MWNPFRTSASSRVPLALQMQTLAEISRLEAAVPVLEAQLHAQTRELGRMRAENVRLAALLARFTAPRMRDARGRYLPTVSIKGESSDV